jgi:HSP20 family protein
MSIETATEGLFGNLGRGPGKMSDPLQKGFVVYSGDTWTPNVNLYEAAGSYFVCVDLAGVEKEKIDVEVANQRLTLRGNRQVPTPDEVGGEAESGSRRLRVHLMEIDHGTFTRVVELPADANHAGITANYRQGMLWIEIPRN